MTEKEKKDIAEIVLAVINSHGTNCQCSLGIKPETAHELISFAVFWRTSKKFAHGAIITALVGGILAALWLGIKSMLKN